jgi:hypothetical protein
MNGAGDLELVSSAAHVGFSFTGRQCTLTAAVPEWLSHNYLQYELDGVYAGRIRITSKVGEPVVITALTGGRHEVWIYKATEAHTGAIIIRKVDGSGLKSLKRPATPLIEFIGNSITCGAAADPAEVPCGTGMYHDQHNAYLAYGPRLARQLGANFLLSSVSGIGVYRNWNSGGPTMPQVYGKTDFQAEGKWEWNFKNYSPAVVSIALGTNDFSTGDGKQQRLPFDSAAFVNEYVRFVREVKAKYPAATIALLNSPMIKGEAQVLLQRCLGAVKASVDAQHPLSKPVALFFFTPFEASGCTGHPGVAEHELMAAEALPFFRELLKK